MKCRYNRDESQKHNTEWKKSYTYDYIFYDSIYMWDSLWITGKSKETESRLIGAGVGKRKEWGLTV